MRKRIYVAAPLSQGRVAGNIAYILRKQGHEVVSTWHSSFLLKPVTDPRELEAKAIVWERCKRELREADHLVIYTASGNPRATYVEMGYFLGLAEQSCDMGCVYWIAPDAEMCPVPVGDDLVIWCESIAKLLDAAGAWPEEAPMTYRARWAFAQDED